MRERAIEVLFKHKLLILLPIVIVMPIAVAAALRPGPQTWQSFAVIWIDQYKPLYSDDRLGYTPATNQAQLLNDFIRTRSFALDALSRTELAATLDDPLTEIEEIGKFQRSVSAWPNSNNFVTIGVNARDPDLAYALAASVVETFQSTLSLYLQERSQAAIRLYTSSLGQARQEVEQARGELSAYVASRPELTNPRIDVTLPTLPLEARDATYARLISDVATKQERYSSLQRRVEELETLAQTGATGQEFAFTVVDAPQRPLAPVPQSRIGRLKLPVIGFAVALVLSSAIGLIVVFTDRSVLGGRDLSQGLRVPVLGEIPEIHRRRRFWQRASRDAVRRRLVTPARTETESRAAGA